MRTFGAGTQDALKPLVMRSHDVRQALFSEGANDLMAHLVQEACEAGDTSIAVVTVDAGPTVLFRAQRGLPDALELSAGASAADWPLRFSGPSDEPIVSPRGLGTDAEPGSAASMLGDFCTIAVPIHFTDELTGALAVIDPRPRSFPADTSARLQQLSTRSLAHLRERARCASISDLREASPDDTTLNAAIRSSVHEARCAYHRMRISATLARWHVAGRLPRSEEFCRVVEEALLAAAELSRYMKDLVRWARKLEMSSPELVEFSSVVGEADLIEPAFRPGLRVVQAAKASVRSPALWASALGALPMAAELDPWGTCVISRLVQSSESLLKVRTSPPAA